MAKVNSQHDILIVSPAAAGSRSGNRVTALRWQKLLGELGHRVSVAIEFRGQRADALIALHARRSAESIEAFHARHPDRPIVVGLSGTDIYGDHPRDPITSRSIAIADRLVALQPAALDRLSDEERPKARVIYQSVSIPDSLRHLEPQRHRWCVIGHIRPVKDPVTVIEACRRLPDDSPISVAHLGEILDEDLAPVIREAQLEIPRYHWLGSRPRGETLRFLARSRGLIHPSRHEGGANVIGEAIRIGRPVLASAIPGNLGLLGDDYPGTFPAGDPVALAELWARADADVEFWEKLRRAVLGRAPLLTPDAERDAWQQLLSSCGIR